MYMSTLTETVVRLSDGAIIPADPANTDYAAFLDWLAAGNEPDPFIPSVPLAPQSVTPLQFMERFTEAEQLAVITAAMSNPELRLWYDKLNAAQEVVFADPRVAAGLDALVGAGLISADRKEALLKP